LFGDSKLLVKASSRLLAHLKYLGGFALYMKTWLPGIFCNDFYGRENPGSETLHLLTSGLHRQFAVVMPCCQGIPLYIYNGRINRI
jgi:hypothetical protein